MVFNIVFIPALKFCLGTRKSVWGIDPMGLWTSYIRLKIATLGLIFQKKLDTGPYIPWEFGCQLMGCCPNGRSSCKRE